PVHRRPGRPGARRGQQRGHRRPPGGGVAGRLQDVGGGRGPRRGGAPAVRPARRRAVEDLRPGHDRLTAMTTDSTTDQVATWQVLARAVVADWRSAVADQLEERPYTTEEQWLLDRSADTPVIPYGSTLLVAVIAARWLVCAQIGDGDMLAVRPDGSSFSPVAG